MSIFARQFDRGCFKRRAALACLFALILGSASDASAQVKGRFRRVGLFEGSNPIVRAGATSFVEVEFAWTGTQAFQGEARVSRQDRDGDVVVSAQEVGLTPDGAWKPVQIYFFPTSVGVDNVIKVRLFDEEGTMVKIITDVGDSVTELESPPFTDQPIPDGLLIIDLSSKRLPHVLGLDTGRSVRVEFCPRLVRSLAPRELPNEWQGLEAVDAIVWDDADPVDVSDRQLDSLIKWVENGGSLLITSGRNWQMLAGSTLAEHLPVKITGSSEVQEVQEFTGGIVKNEVYSAALSKRYRKKPVIRSEMRPQAGAIGIPFDSKGLSPIAYRRALGRGNLTFVGASLRELLPPPSKAIGFLEGSQDVKDAQASRIQEFQDICDKVVALNFLALPKSQSSDYPAMSTNLFEQLSSSISFKGLGFAFLMFAILFAVAYIISAIGSHMYLKHRDIPQHSWSAFAIVSLLASVIGLGMVWTLRGLTTKVRQTTVIDSHAGMNYGWGMCLFGVKTPDHTRLNLRLPSGYESTEPGLLRALPRSTNRDEEATFVASDTYRAELHGTQLAGVPVRATLKEFSGRWHGPMTGSLDARLVVPRGETVRFGEGSYIHNNTGVTLEDCWIFEGRQEIAGEAGVVTTRCLRLGTLEKSGEDSMLDGPTLHRRLYFAPRSADADPDAPLLPYPETRFNLKTIMGDWRRGLSNWSLTGDNSTQQVQLSATQEYDLIKLLSFFDLSDMADTNRIRLSRSYGRVLDCSHQVTQETAILIGYSSEPSPAKLEVNGSVKAPEKSITIYRFVIPVERPRGAEGEPSSGDKRDSTDD